MSGTTRWDLVTAMVGLASLTSVWRIQDLFPVLATIQLPTLAMVAMYAAFVVDRDPRRRLRVVRGPILALGTAILALMVLSVPGGVYPGYSFSFILKDHIKTYLLLLLVAGSIRDFDDVKRLTMVQLGGAILYAGMAARMPVGTDGRLGDLFYYDANDLGMLIVMTLPLIVFFLRREEAAWRRVMWGGGAGILMLALVKSGSRGGFLGLLGIGIYLLFRFRAIKAHTRVSAIAALFLLMMVFGSDKYWSMMGTLLHPTNDYNWSGKAESGRMEVWKRGIGYMMSHPLTGVGANAFPAAEGMISPLAERQSLGIGLKWSAAHNSFVQIGAELGVGGLVIFLVLLYRAARLLHGIGNSRAGPGGGSSREDAMAQAFAGALVGYLVAGFFLSQAYSAYLYTLLGLIAGLARVASTGAPPASPKRAAWRSSAVPVPPVS